MKMLILILSVIIYTVIIYISGYKTGYVSWRIEEYERVMIDEETKKNI